MAAYKLYNYGHKVKQRTPTPDLDKTLTITALRISSDLDVGGKFFPRSSLVQTPTIKVNNFFLNLFIQIFTIFLLFLIINTIRSMILRVKAQRRAVIIVQLLKCTILKKKETTWWRKL